ncbi:hypothetical protein, partial [Sporolactobacillus terrae]|uniref:hypothetical protein n=1 Tax=Sporolactobacillus terrae TaxID=269673 RepID=UPI001C3F3C9E
FTLGFCSVFKDHSFQSPSGDLTDYTLLLSHCQLFFNSFSNQELSFMSDNKIYFTSYLGNVNRLFMIFSEQSFAY